MMDNKINVMISLVKGIFVIAASTALILFTIISCDTVEEEPDYTYTIENVWWSDSIDGNSDGYPYFKRLNFNVHIAEDVSQRISPRIYYKVHDATTYSFYAYANDYQATGGGQDNNVFVSIGSPNKELSRGHYDFSIEIYEPGNDRLEAKTDSTFDNVLMNNPFEESSADKVYSVDAWWTNQYDRNKNEYWRNAQLNFDVDVEEGVTKTVDVDLLFRNSESETYTLYNSFNDITITGTTNQDSVSYTVGLPNDELEYGTYDFRINVYEAGSSVLAAFIDEGSSQLNDVKFETEDEDSYFYSVEKVWWTDLIDNDGDGYTSSRLLNFNVDVDKEDTREIYAKVYFRHPDSSDYSIYDSTANFSIHEADTTDFNKMFITQLDSSEYDFLITVLESQPYDSARHVEASVSGFSDSFLADQKFEAVLQDTSGANLTKRRNHFIR